MVTMACQLDVIFRELGLEEYLETFVNHGFDSWETTLDVKESDLDILGVKLGHRRKLQRYIATSRRAALEVAIASPTLGCSTGDERPEPQRLEYPKLDGVKDGGITKRKYRRRPKVDLNAPERPPSGYVLFSNKIREELKDRNLSFADIAKLVGGRWQALPVAQKEPFEQQAQQSKIKYHSDLAAYKKTPECHRYNEYLLDFRLKHASSTQSQRSSCQSSNGPRPALHNHSSHIHQDRNEKGSSAKPPSLETTIANAMSTHTDSSVSNLEAHSSGSVGHRSTVPPTLLPLCHPSVAAGSPATQENGHSITPCYRLSPHSPRQPPPRRHSDQLPSLSTLLEGPINPIRRSSFDPKKPLPRNFPPNLLERPHHEGGTVPSIETEQRHSTVPQVLNSDMATPLNIHIPPMATPPPSNPSQVLRPWTPHYQHQPQHPHQTQPGGPSPAVVIPRVLTPISHHYHDHPQPNTFSITSVPPLPLPCPGPALPCPGPALPSLPHEDNSFPITQDHGINPSPNIKIPSPIHIPIHVRRPLSPPHHHPAPTSGGALPFALPAQNSTAIVAITMPPSPSPSSPGLMAFSASRGVDLEGMGGLQGGGLVRDHSR